MQYPTFLVTSVFKVKSSDKKTNSLFYFWCHALLLPLIFMWESYIEFERGSSDLKLLNKIWGHLQNVVSQWWSKKYHTVELKPNHQSV